MSGGGHNERTSQQPLSFSFNEAGLYECISLGYSVSTDPTDTAPDSVQFAKSGWRRRSAPRIVHSIFDDVFGMEAVPPSRCGGKTPAVEIRKPDTKWQSALGSMGQSELRMTTYRRCGAADDAPFVETGSILTLVRPLFSPFTWSDEY